MDQVDKVKRLLQKFEIADDPQVSFYSEGEGNINFLVQDEGKKYLFRQKKDTEKQFEDSLAKEYAFLAYAESKDINFCPHVYFHNQEYNFLVESFLDGRELSQADLSNQQIDIYAKQLAELARLDVEEFFDFCEANDLRKIRPVDPVESLQIYGFNRFGEINKHEVGENIYNWIEKNLQKNLELLKQKDINDSDLRFSLGDVQPSVIINNSKVYLFDFEHVNIVKTESDINYIKIHGKFSKKQFDYFVDRYALYTDKDKEVLLREGKLKEGITRVNDVVWAAMKWSKTKEDKFRKLTLKRIGLVKSYISKHNRQGK